MFRCGPAVPSIPLADIIFPNTGLEDPALRDLLCTKTTPEKDIRVRDTKGSTTPMGSNRTDEICLPQHTTLITTTTITGTHTEHHTQVPPDSHNAP